MGGYEETKIFNIFKRKSIIIKYIIFIALIFIISTILIFKAASVEKVIDIVYDEKSNIDYKVGLKKNDFFEEEYWGQDNQYIASLIDYIDVEFDYDLLATGPDMKYKYSYKIVADTNIRDKETDKSLYRFSEDIITKEQSEQKTNSQLRIDEKVKVDYNKYNKIINRFVDVYDLNNFKSDVTINMYVNVVDGITKTSTENATPVMSVTIPLTTQTMAIDIESHSVNNKAADTSATLNQKSFEFSAIILAIIDVILVIKLVIFVKNTKDEKAMYNMILRKIMSNYGSYIQKLNNEYDFSEKQILEIKSFEDLLQVRETINKPILMTEKILAMETYFIMPADSNVYVYELKAGNLRRNKAKNYNIKENKVG